MEAEQVIEKILADAKSQADEIKAEADKKSAAEQKQFDEQMSDYKKQTAVLAERAGKDKKSHLLAAARMDIAKDYLADKRAILDEVFALAQTQLENLPDEEYCSLMGKLMIEAVETGDEEVIVSTTETRIDSAFIAQINKKLSADGKGDLKLSGDKQEMAGGFILRRGKVKTNVSLDIILSQACKELEIELAKQVFGNEE